MPEAMSHRILDWIGDTMELGMGALDNRAGSCLIVLCLLFLVPIFLATGCVVRLVRR